MTDSVEADPDVAQQDATTLFSDSAKRALASATDVAQLSGERTVSASHVLTAALQIDPAWRDLFERVGVHAPVSSNVTPPNPETSQRALQLGDDSKSAIEYAVSEARRLHHSHVRNEHLLLGIVRLAVESDTEELRPIRDHAVELATAIEERMPKRRESYPARTLDGLPALSSGSTVRENEVTSLLGADDPQLLHRFTRVASHVTTLARGEADLLRHVEIHSAHLLLALASERDCIAAQLLDAYQLDLDTLRQSAAEVLPAIEAMSTDAPTWSNEATAALIEAVRVASEGGYEFATSAHILHGVLHDADGTACRLLQQCKVTPSSVQSALQQALRLQQLDTPSVFQDTTFPKGALEEDSEATDARTLTRNVIYDIPMMLAGFGVMTTLSIFVLWFIEFLGGWSPVIAIALYAGVLVVFLRSAYLNVRHNTKERLYSQYFVVNTPVWIYTVVIYLVVGFSAVNRHLYLLIQGFDATSGAYWYWIRYGIAAFVSAAFLDAFEIYRLKISDVQPTAWWSETLLFLFKGVLQVTVVGSLVLALRNLREVVTIRKEQLTGEPAEFMEHAGQVVAGSALLLVGIPLFVAPIAVVLASATTGELNADALGYALLHVTPVVSLFGIGVWITVTWVRVLFAVQLYRPRVTSEVTLLSTGSLFVIALGLILVLANLEALVGILQGIATR